LLPFFSPVGGVGPDRLLRQRGLEQGPVPALVALFIAVGALHREESRGAHYRSDFPVRSTEFAYRHRLSLADLQEWSEDTLEALARGAVGA